MSDAHATRPPAWSDQWETEWSKLRTGVPGGDGHHEADGHQGTGEAPGVDDDAGGPSTRLVPVRVVRIDKGGITVAADPTTERLVVAAKAVRRVVVGDVCGLDPDAGRIEVILPRRTVFERRSPGAEREDITTGSRALAANMDTVLVLQALDAGVNTSRLTREIVLAWDSGARPVVVLTKTDLVEADYSDRQIRTAAQFAPGVPVVGVSSKPHEATPGDDDGIAALAEHLPPGTVAALLGASGAGKSTLANTLAGRPLQLTAEVREGDQRGRHTTTAGQMLPLSHDRWLIDTPGIRGVGLLHADRGLELAFSDLSEYAQHCRFSDCSHSSEPGCGILAAVAEGNVDRERLETWHQLVAEVEALEDSVEEQQRAAEREYNQRSRRRAAAQRGRPRR